MRVSRIARVARWIPAVALLLPCLLAPLNPDPARRIELDSAPFKFHFLNWEAQHLPDKLGSIARGLISPLSTDLSDAEVAQAYFQMPQDQREPLRDAAETAIERTIASVYAAGGATRPTPLGQRVFPPFIISLTPPPAILIVAPRNALVVQQSVMLKTDLSLSQQEALEQSTESLSVSALVTPIGGIGASYPSMILEDASPRVTLRRAAHEWVHQYLFFSPLGQDYWRSQEAREINESAADLVSVEVGDTAFAVLGLHDQSSPPGAAPTATFNFQRFMRNTRAHVEQQLATGRIDEAEAYMRARRDTLQQHGYDIRKVNQAFFAFYGSFADGFGASPSDPTAELLRTLRARSPSLGAFLATLQRVTSLADLLAAANRCDQSLAAGTARCAAASVS
ncbi:MAG TPA: hypothetical protein VGJ60_35830 [Chloroflexota bacterium]